MPGRPADKSPSLPTPQAPPTAQAPANRAAAPTTLGVALLAVLCVGVLTVDNAQRLAMGSLGSRPATELSPLDRRTIAAWVALTAAKAQPQTIKPAPRLLAPAMHSIEPIEAMRKPMTPRLGQGADDPQRLQPMASRPHLLNLPPPVVG